MTADNDDVTRGSTDDPAGDLAELASGAEYRTTELPCVICLTTLSLDDDRPKLGTVRWHVAP